MKMKQKTLSNYDFFIKANTSAFKGEWVAISGKKIVSHGKDAQEVYKKARQKGKTSNISLAKIPEEDILILKSSK